MRISPQLHPYVSLPRKDSLVLVTGVLGATSNWLVVRFLCDALAENTADDVAVVFVSFLRDFEFWKAESRRAGVDLARLGEQRRFAFVNGLNALFLPTLEAQEPPAALQERQPLTANHAPPSLTSNTRSVPTRPALGSNQRIAPSTSSSTGKPQNGRFTLTSPSTDHLEETIQQAIEYVSKTGNLHSEEQNRKVLLILDSPDILLATATPSNTSPPMDLNASILQLRSLVHSAVVACAADMPLLSTSASSTPLEMNHAAFVTRSAHSASYTMSLRLLDTGFAADVSGVLRITKGNEQDSLNVEEKELLYYIGGDSSVKVFERGASTTS